MYTQIIDRINFDELRSRVNEKFHDLKEVMNIITQNTLIRQVLCLLFDNEENLMGIREYLFENYLQKGLFASYHRIMTISI